MSNRTFFAELKRRNVYKVAVAYLVVAWLLIQAASIFFPAFEAPGWVMKAVICAILLGFPIALILAWAFELTPEGIKRTEEVAPSESITHRTGRKFGFVISRSQLAWVYLALGRKTDALRISREAAESLTIEMDAILGAVGQVGLAEIEAWAGEPQDATNRLRHLLSIPSNISIVRLKIDPVWDPIRNHSDFQKLLTGPEQIGPNK